MSNYVLNIGSAIIKALEGVPRAQPALVAGYWENIDFWLGELAHLIAVSDGYDDRLSVMKLAHDGYLRGSAPHNQDDFGIPFQSAVSTTSNAERKRMISSARASLRQVADRALDLCLISVAEYNGFIERLRVT